MGSSFECRLRDHRMARRLKNLKACLTAILLSHSLNSSLVPQNGPVLNKYIYTYLFDEKSPSALWREPAFESNMFSLFHNFGKQR